MAQAWQVARDRLSAALVGVPLIANLMCKEWIDGNR